MGGRDDFEEMVMKADDLFGSLNCISIIGDTERFRQWFQKEHPNVSLEETLSGYRFAVETAIRTFINNIELYSSLDITEDFVFFRARFFGASINKVPNTCDKTILIKNIARYLRDIRKASGWDEVASVMKDFNQNVDSVFREIYKTKIGVPSKVNIPKDDALKYSTMFMVNTFLVNSSRGIPQGYSTSTVPMNLRNEEELKDALFGYKYALQFIWASLLGDRYASTPLTNLNKATEWCIDDDVFLEEEPEIKPKETYLDSYYSIIHEEVLQPIEKEFKIDFAFSKILYVSKPISKQAYGSLLAPPPEPPLSEKEKIDVMLLWYQIEFLDSSKNTIFSGVPALLSILAGAVEMKRVFAGGEKVQVRRFVHPDPSVSGNDYSYAVLIEARGSSGISDYSGWELFYDCCGDYSGFSGSQHAMVEGLIEAYTKQELIELQEYEIDKTKFKKYVADKTAADKQQEVLWQLEKEEEIRESRDLSGEERGIVFELITYYTLTKLGGSEVEWNVALNKHQLDVIIETTDTYRLVECKVNPNNMNVEKEVEKLMKKLERQTTTKSNKKCEFWFLTPPSQQTVQKLKELKMNYEVLSEKFKSHIWKKKKFDKLKTIFPELRDYLN